MTYLKGYSGGGGGGGRTGGSSDEVEHMIGRRVEKMTPIFIIGFILCWVATAGGVYVGVTVYPWAYPLCQTTYLSNCRREQRVLACDTDAHPRRQRPPLSRHPALPAKGGTTTAPARARLQRGQSAG